MEESRTAPHKDSHEIVIHNNPDYPVGVYYVEPAKMYMDHVRWHWHEELEINLVKEGTAQFHIGEDIIQLGEGQSILINRDILHSIHDASSGNCVILSMMFHPHFLFEDENSSTAALYMKPLISDPNFHYMIFDRKDIWGRNMLTYIHNMMETNFTKEFGYELITKSNLSEFWLNLLKKIKVQPLQRDTNAKAFSPDQNRVKEAILYIEEHFNESISLDDIANSIHISKSECCRCFKRAVGFTPFEYLMRYRILQAAERILMNDKSASSIANLAASVGFNNTSYFNKLFKEYFHCTPLQYRKMCKTEHRDKLSIYGLSLSHI